MSDKPAFRPATSDELDHLGFGLIRTKPGFKPEMVRVGVVNGRIISHILIEHYTLRYGQVWLKVGGLSKLYTEPEYRNQGYATALMQDALAYMMEQGIHLALMQGVPGYFARFGFNPVWPEYSITFPSAEASQLPQNLHLRPPHRQEIPQIAALYERHWAGRVAMVRDAETWLWRVTTAADHNILVAVNRDKQVLGYLAGRDLYQPTTEIVADTYDAALTLLAEGGRLQAENAYVQWLLPPDDVLIIHARRVLDVQLSVRYALQGGWMARLIDSTALVEALLPEISTQASVIYPRFNAERLVLDCLPDGVTIGMKYDEATFCQLSYRDFIQVLFGVLSPAALALQVELTPEALRLLHALFPPRMAALAPWDWF